MYDTFQKPEEHQYQTQNHMINSPIFGREPYQITPEKKYRLDPASRPAAGQRLEVTNAQSLLRHGMIPNEPPRSKSFDNIMMNNH